MRQDIGLEDANRSVSLISAWDRWQPLCRVGRLGEEFVNRRWMFSPNCLYAGWFVMLEANLFHEYGRDTITIVRICLINKRAHFREAAESCG